MKYVFTLTLSVCMYLLQTPKTEQRHISLTLLQHKRIHQSEIRPSVLQFIMGWHGRFVFSHMSCLSQLIARGLTIMSSCALSLLVANNYPESRDRLSAEDVCSDLSTATNPYTFAVSNICHNHG